MSSSTSLDKALKGNPNATKVADGYLIKGDGWVFHAFEQHSAEEIEGLDHAEIFYLPFCTREEILRMRDKKKAEDHLLWLRAEAIADQPRFCRVFRSRLKNAKNWSLTNWYAKKESARDEYLNGLMRSAMQKVSPIPAGMALLKDVNAMCCKTEHGNYIAISEALEHFLYYMNLATYGETFKLDIKDQMAALVIGVRTMLGTESIDFDIDPRGTPPRLIDEAIKKLTHDQLSFTFGHEYAHHLLGHLSQGQIKKKSLSEIFYANELGKSVGSYSYKHKQEYEADFFSIKNIKSNTEYKNRLANAAFIMFSHFSVLNHALEVMAVKSQFKSDHPDPIDRIWKLRRRLNRKIGMQSEEIENLLARADQFKKILAENFIPLHFEELEMYGSHYLPSYKEKILVDRVDF
ncbi:M48 family metalloprotease [Janthinobacterium sp. LM6]|uniref:M48 family metalloprotease n=1 Tax=Janthinobacterium sp. LM6 TaxID=1938606 RepID=UPI00123707D9|nr:M48 family metalloprotease [Janthinobacterium sp. LM6]